VLVAQGSQCAASDHHVHGTPLPGQAQLVIDGDQAAALPDVDTPCHPRQ
jgi:hypothetical protein